MESFKVSALRVIVEKAHGPLNEGALGLFGKAPCRISLGAAHKSCMSSTLASLRFRV